MRTPTPKSPASALLLSLAVMALNCHTGCYLHPSDEPDAGVPDAGVPDAGIPMRSSDAGPPDAGVPVTGKDAGWSADGGPDDAGPVDAGANDAGPADGGPPALHILFIGDSYTYVNDLPGMLAQIAATSGVPPAITTGEVVQGGATLQDQWNNRLAQAAILDGGWTQVVLQGQSQEPLAEFGFFSDFPTYADSFVKLIAAAGAQPAFFVTWARAAGDPVYAPPNALFAIPAQMQDELTAAYASAAHGSSQSGRPLSLLACAGEAFQRSLARYPQIVLQQSDRSHPTVAGTYLAACTFYVALTGQPVPSQSAVPAGLSAADAASLRDIAQVGSDCAGVHVKGIIDTTFPLDADGGCSFDYGTAGSPITTGFVLTNRGGTAVGLSESSLAPPFVSALVSALDGGAPCDPFNGGCPSGTGFCSSSLQPGHSCTLSVTYTGASSATERLTLDFTGAYLSSASCDLHGTATQRALLAVSAAAAGCGDSCDLAQVQAFPGTTTSLDVFLVNRGALPVTQLGVGTPLLPPFSWAGGAFPGDAGNDFYPSCSAATLGVGEQCRLTVAFSPTDAGGLFTGAANLAYSDALGPVLPNANQNIEGRSQ